MKVDDLSQDSQTLVRHVLMSVDAAHLDALTRASVEDALRGVFVYLDANPAVRDMLIYIHPSLHSRAVPAIARLNEMAEWHLGKLDLANADDRLTIAAWDALIAYLNEHQQVAEMFVRGVNNLASVGAWERRRRNSAQ